ncbi:DUF3592 domain-containing protein [Luteolibacter sp. AS25]|uniref:DUF3592 domain-containing protein n=1 Tax=Luteolibacter sp. AS25 TaxID=3135776 RepID=UPI00398AD074
MKFATIFLILLGLCISAIGGLFTVLMWKSYERAVDQRGWPQVEAVVLSSEMEEWQHDEFSPKEYRLNLLYGYEWEGEAKTSERLSVRGNPSYNKSGKVQGMLKEYPTGGRVMAYVNPGDPNFAILMVDSKAAGYSIWFPMLFLLGGLVIAVSAIVKSLRNRG